jgi:hypothetical protein
MPKGPGRIERAISTLLLLSLAAHISWRWLRAQDSEGWHPQEEKHRRHERRYWPFSFLLTLAVAFGAGAIAFYAHRAATEAHEQSSPTS